LKSLTHQTPSIPHLRSKPSFPTTSHARAWYAFLLYPSNKNKKINLKQITLNPTLATNLIFDIASVPEINNNAQITRRWLHALIYSTSLYREKWKN
jgi:hypothetical protein